MEANIEEIKLALKGALEQIEELKTALCDRDQTLSNSPRPSARTSFLDRTPTVAEQADSQGLITHYGLWSTPSTPVTWCMACRAPLLKHAHSNTMSTVHGETREVSAQVIASD
jgi:hypothetical protein